MSVAHVISEVEVPDEALADRYRALAQASIAEYGGRYVARAVRLAGVRRGAAYPRQGARAAADALEGVARS